MLCATNTSLSLLDLGNCKLPLISLVPVPVTFPLRLDEEKDMVSD